jgi:antitoxin component YwqK of YwqJK toxin-antitoxin module
MNICNKSIPLIINLLIINNYIYAQNILDSLGRKQGEWRYEEPYDSFLQFSPHVIAFYKNDTLHGRLQKLDHKNRLRYEELIANGRRVGIAKAYDAKGRIIYSFHFQEDQLISRTGYYGRGKVYKIIELDNGKLSGTEVVFHRNGKPWIKRSYSAGKLHGDWMTFYKNGKLQSVFHFENDIFHQRTFYRRNGKEKRVRQKA